MEWLHAMTCMDLNGYIAGVAGAAVVGNIFWFFKWCAAKGEANELRALTGIDVYND